MTEEEAWKIYATAEWNIVMCAEWISTIIIINIVCVQRDYTGFEARAYFFEKILIFLNFSNGDEPYYEESGLIHEALILWLNGESWLFDELPCLPLRLQIFSNKKPYFIGKWEFLKRSCDG